MAKVFEDVAIASDGKSEWHPSSEGRYKIACCDCGLVHDYDFRVRDKATGKLIRGVTVEWRCSRNERSTGQLRRYGVFDFVKRRLRRQTK